MKMFTCNMCGKEVKGVDASHHKCLTDVPSHLRIGEVFKTQIPDKPFGDMVVILSVGGRFVMIY